MSGLFNIKGIWWRHYVPMFCLTVFLLIPWTRQYFTAVGVRWLYIFFLSFSLSFCLTPLFRWLAYVFGILDRPGGRKDDGHPPG